MITNAPTQINIVLRGSLPASFADKGAAMVPPMINPKITGQWLTPSMMKNVTALASVTKNSVMLTDPITYFGLLPLEIKVLVTNGPHPPPPKESTCQSSPKAIPERDSFGKDVIAFANRPIEPETDYLPEHGVERRWYLRSEKVPVFAREFPPRLEVVGHVKCLACAVPVG